MGRKVFVVGVGMTKFEKPGSKDWDYPDMAKQAGSRALEDAGIAYDAIEQAAVGYCYGDSTCGERAVYTLGLTGIPIYNVNNNCSTGSTALFMAKQFIEGGLADCTLALGFEKMEKGSLGIKYTDRTNPMDKHAQAMIEMNGYEPKSPAAAQFFGNAGREHMEKYGTKPEHFAKIGWKNHKHSVNNPYSQFQDEYSLEDIQNAKMVYDPLTKLQCCPTSDGAGAAILASEEFVKKHGLQAKAVEILGQAMTTDYESTFSKSAIKLVGSDMTKKAAEKVYAQSGFGPENVDVVELHDCFSCNEMITYEGLGLCPEGKGGEFVDSGANTYGGKVVVNPSGGLISKGHPLGATGLAQCAELNWQLRGEADARQVDGAKLALQHNLGLGGAAVVTMYRKAEIA
jgi:sterol carrier protein 2